MTYLPDTALDRLDFLAGKAKAGATEGHDAMTAPEPDVAALYVMEGGPYYDLPGVDPWPESRDARRYAGPLPVVAHPPCSSWCQLASVNEKRYGRRIGDDSGCFDAALRAVRTWGGVLEHPAFTLAWARFGLNRPTPGSWSRGLFDDGWVCEVSQAAYGHPARKLTWLYYVGPEPTPLRRERQTPEAWVGHDAQARNPRRHLGPREASATPPAFRDALLSLARSARPAALMPAGPP